ncbi:hypothetical protein GLE_1136 [Lysobacter enzymogenes]|uniref:Uncharacterized protein n=1 Tax=Lysobacter enzymogenes TaxID=69 RepID=A0A0S2DD76_LYSEN|nr:hypothetical protein GLE_1136 [Lysobacter enzymogenes]
MCIPLILRAAARAPRRVFAALRAIRPYLGALRRAGASVPARER